MSDLPSAGLRSNISYAVEYSRHEVHFISFSAHFFLFHLRKANLIGESIAVGF